MEPGVSTVRSCIGPAVLFFLESVEEGSRLDRPADSCFEALDGLSHPGLVLYVTLTAMFSALAFVAWALFAVSVIGALEWLLGDSEREVL